MAEDDDDESGDDEVSRVSRGQSFRHLLLGMSKISQTFLSSYAHLAVAGSCFVMKSCVVVPLAC